MSEQPQIKSLGDNISLFCEAIVSENDEPVFTWIGPNKSTCSNTLLVKETMFTSTCVVNNLTQFHEGEWICKINVATLSTNKTIFVNVTGKKIVFTSCSYNINEYTTIQCLQYK